MISDNLGINNQSAGENIGTWGDVINANNTRYTELLNCLIIQGSVDNKILHVFPTDNVGNPKLTVSMYQPKEVSSPLFADIISGLIGSNDVQYPVSGGTPVVFGTLNAAIARAAVLSGLAINVEIFLHPGVHVITSNIVVPAGVVIRGVSKAVTTISLQGANILFSGSYSGLKNLSIVTTGSSYISFQPPSTSALSGLETIDCSISVPVYFDCNNVVNALDLFMKGNEFNSSLNFMNSSGSIVTLATMVLMNNYINKNMVYIGSVIGTQGTRLSLQLYDQSLSSSMKTETDAFITALKNAVASATDFPSLQTAVAALNTASYTLSGVSGSVSMGTPGPILRNNYYA